MQILFIYTQINGFKYCYQIQIIQFDINKQFFLTHKWDSDIKPIFFHSKQ